MIGAVQYILNKKSIEISSLFRISGEKIGRTAWWDAFNAKLKKCVMKRNDCCHPQLFKWQDVQKLIEYGFEDKLGSETNVTTKLNGVFFESEVGRKLKTNR